MKTSELISKPQALQAEHGDLEVVVDQNRWPEGIKDAVIDEAGYSKLCYDGTSGTTFTKYEWADVVFEEGPYLVTVLELDD